MEGSVDQEQDLKQAEGFSLIEILLAVAILAIVCLGIMALLPNGYKQITNAGRRSTMDHIAQQQLDYLRSIPISHQNLTSGQHPTTALWPMPNGVADKYSVYWIVSNGTLTNSRNIRLYVGYDTLESDGLTPKSSSEAVDQDSHIYTTTITQ